MSCLGTKIDHVKLYSPKYVFLTKILRGNSPAPIYAILHGAVSCKGYFTLPLVENVLGTTTDQLGVGYRLTVTTRHYGYN